MGRVLSIVQEPTPLREFYAAVAATGRLPPLDAIYLLGGILAMHGENLRVSVLQRKGGNRTVLWATLNGKPHWIEYKPRRHKFNVHVGDTDAPIHMVIKAGVRHDELLARLLFDG